MQERFRLYFSALMHGAKYGDSTNERIAKGGAYRLVTFAYPKELPEWINVVERVGGTTSLLIDSGAFTAWNAGGRTSLKELIDYNKKAINLYGDKHGFAFISLDVIPGERGRRATSEEVAKAVDESIDNFKVMQQEFPGHYVLPVYHSGEDVAVRNTYMGMTDYICLSMNQDMAEDNRVKWAVRSIVDGYKFHGLAATGNRMVTEVPWFSVDSSSWLSSGAMGGIYIDDGKGTMRKLNVSENSPARHEKGQHFDSLSEIERSYLRKYVADRGFDIEKLRVDLVERHKWNIDRWLTSSWRYKPQPKVQELF